MAIVALVEDLVFESRIRSVAARVGADVVFVRAAREAGNLGAVASALLLDMTVDTAEVLELIRRLRNAQPRPRVIVFLPHVQAELARAAREAGADIVLPRSKFVERLEEILAGASAS